jgi:hypothetical protein
MVVVGTEKVQRVADALLARVEGAGFRAVPVHGPDGYEIRVPGFTDPTRAAMARHRLAAAGAGAPEVREAVQDLSNPGGPFVARVLEVDPEQIEIVVAHARDVAQGLETTRDLARRRGATAAINGGFFTTSGPFAGESEGVLVVDGRLLSEPDRGRAGFAFERGEEGARALFDRLGYCGRAWIGEGAAAPFAVDGVNRARRTGEVVLFTPEFHATTMTEPGGLEVVFVEGRITEVRPTLGSSPIPRWGGVLSFAPGVTVPAGLDPGARIEVELRLVPKTTPSESWEGVDGALGAGPLLLRAGEFVLRPELEAISRVFAEARHPRTAVAARADGSLLFVTVDGRQPDWSVGMTLVELTDFLLALGAVDAVNLDGGGSTAMVIGGETVNRPSDPAGDRANGDAILLFAR